MNETLEITCELQEQISALQEQVNELAMKLDAITRAMFGSYEEVEAYLKKDEIESK